MARAELSERWTITAAGRAAIEERQMDTDLDIARNRWDAKHPQCGGIPNGRHQVGSRDLHVAGDRLEITCRHCGWMGVLELDDVIDTLDGLDVAWDPEEGE